MGLRQRPAPPIAAAGGGRSAPSFRNLDGVMRFAQCEAAMIDRARSHGLRRASTIFHMPRKDTARPDRVRSISPGIASSGGFSSAPG